MRRYPAALAIAALAMFTVTCLAQPAMSRGQQHLSISYNDCLSRAQRALQNAGFSAGGAGNFAQGFKDVSGAYIICNDAPGGGMIVNIVVATNVNDAGVPGQLRQMLQAQMENPGTPPPRQPAGDMRTLLLTTTFDWIDNGSRLGTITFSADGRAVPTWSGMAHTWRIDPNGELMVYADGTRYVVRLRYDPRGPSFSGARDRTSQTQDGVQTVMRPAR